MRRISGILLPNISAAAIASASRNITRTASMASKLVPSNPSEVMVIREVTPNISTLSVPFARFGKILVGGRATMVRLSSGSIAVFSPVALTEEVKAHLASWAPGSTVKYLIAPDIEHHIFLGAWHTAYPDALILGPEGLPEKRAKQGDQEVPFSTVFTAANKGKTRVDDAAFNEDFEYEYIPEHANKELVFFAKKERTLVQADLMFNLPATEQYSRVPGGLKGNAGFLTKLFTQFQSTEPNKAKWQSRFIWYAAGAQDRAGFNRSMRRIDGWDFDRIIPCHGDVIESGGKDVFRRVFAWNLDAANREAEAAKTD